MKTLAFWYRRTGQNDSSVGVDLHFNFWKIHNKKKKADEYLLDIGMMVQSISKVSEIYIYFPFKMSDFHVQDLGSILIDNHDLICSIFNENYSISRDPKIPKQVKVKEKDNAQAIFHIYALDTDNNDANLIEKFDGTILSIPINTFPINTGCDKFYFRFRLNGSAIQSIIKYHKSNYSFFQSAFSAIETIDFRVNEKRNYSGSLKEAVSLDQEFDIKKIHFLLLRDAQDDFLSSHIHASCRELEPSLWDKYVGSDRVLENIFAYHWSKKSETGNIDSFNTLAKIRFYKSNIKTIAIYVLVLIFLSCMAAYIKDGIDYYIKRDKVSINRNIDGAEETHRANQPSN